MTAAVMAAAAVRVAVVAMAMVAAVTMMAAMAAAVRWLESHLSETDRRRRLVLGPRSGTLLFTVVTTKKTMVMVQGSDETDRALEDDNRRCVPCGRYLILKPFQQRRDPFGAHALPNFLAHQSWGWHRCARSESRDSRVLTRRIGWF